MKVSACVLFLFVCSFLSCQQQPPPGISFYYWKTTFRLTNDENQALLNNKVKTLYIRYFDIALDPTTKEPYPLSPIIFLDTPSQFHCVPVVYIKNEVFLDTKTDTKDLAEKTFSYIEQINKATGIGTNEIQVDCDWTLKSRDKYLDYIVHLKRVSKKILSATIRLHQVKYASKTKVPKVDYGVLMYYNMGKLAADNTNSIYDRSVALPYLQALKSYPLPLKIAMPIFSWGVHIRNKRIIQLMSKWSVESFDEDANFAINGNMVTVKNATLKDGAYFQKGDIVKIEHTTKEQMIEMGNDLRRQLKNPPAEILFYDLDSMNLRHYDKGIYTKVAHRF